MKDRLDERLLDWLLRGDAGLGDYRRDALQTYRDLRRDAARSRGWRGVLELFFHSAGRALVALLEDRFSSSSPAARKARGSYLRGSLRRSLEMPTLLAHDVRTALRGLRRRPAFALTVIATLAVGIGATTVMFGVVDGVLLRQLPYPQADRLLYFDDGSHPGPVWQSWAERQSTFETVAAVWDGQDATVTGEGAPLRLPTAAASADFLPLFGARAQHGRLLGADDSAADRVIVLSAGAWQRQWGSDPSMVGRTVSLDGEPFTVVGVLAPDFVPPEALTGPRIDIWKPLDLDHAWMSQWDVHILGVVGKLRADADATAAQADVDHISHQLADLHESRRAEDGSPEPTTLVPLRQATIGDIDSSLGLLLGAVGLMLLVGCANVANLLLARGMDRRREMALHAALGAHRGRLASILLVESLVLSAVGGLLGLGLAYLGMALFAELRPDGLPRMAEVGVDARVLGFALCVSMITGLLSGLAPAFQAAGTDLHPDLKPTPGAGFGPRRVREGLVVAEMAMALMLLVGAGLLGQALFGLVTSETGFEEEGLTRIHLDLGEGEEMDSAQRYPVVRDLVERVGAVPGVVSIGAGWTAPFDHTGGSRCCWWSPFRSDERSEPLQSFVHPITPDYFATLGVRLLQGRELEWQDGTVSPVPVVLGQSTARALFGGDDVVGQRLVMGSAKPVETRVVGVVDDVRHWGMAHEPAGGVYVPYAAYGGGVGLLSIVVRTETELSPALAESLRQAVWQVDPGLPVASVETLPRMISDSLGEPRFYSLLFLSFAGFALLLAATGIASSLLYAIGRRRRELGIRIAVGARGRDLLWSVVGQGMWLTGLGMVLGLVAASLLSHLLESLVPGLESGDPLTFLAVSSALASVALLSCLLPALVAARTDPVRALRAE